MVIHNSESISCHICGLNYVRPTDNREHASYCEKYVRACVKFDTIFHHKQRETMKRDSYTILRNEESSMSEKVIASEKLFRAYFSRSVESSGFNLNHPVFTDYCAMLLNQEHWRNFIEQFPGVYALLLKKYGRKGGISEGKTIADIITQKGVN